MILFGSIRQCINGQISPGKTVWGMFNMRWPNAGFAFRQRPMGEWFLRVLKYLKLPARFQEESINPVIAFEFHAVFRFHK